ncbi:MAG: bifunctional homocysteine S-methyltransferase/methylenetetrahydrofolate reductase [Fibrobacteres bacterium]|nr:bifunctional homocysteine S-methyltransferase/methylenetetrahydrofolate reductase [Fibrobacterota bacterium]
MVPFLTAVKSRIILADGAMGTELYKAGFFINQSYDSLNITAPNKVSAIHAAYVAAGADLLETNTYGANRVKLTSYGLGDQFETINKKGVELARAATEGKDIYIAGSIGQAGHGFKKEEAAMLLCEQAQVLEAAGADLILLESFADMEELAAASKAIKAKVKIPVVAQHSIVISGTVRGLSTEDEGELQSIRLIKMAEQLSRIEADVLGLNCGSGPTELLEAIQVLLKHTDKPVSCMPNAGHPAQVGDRMLYLSTPEYLGEYSGRMIRAGVKIVGGCCGTSPLHIKEMRNVITSIQPRLDVKPVKITVTSSDKPPVEPVPLSKRSSFAEKLVSGKFVSSVEVNPPKGLDCSKQIAAAEMLKKAGVDAINIADGPRASSRMSPMSMAIQVRNKVDMDIIIHYCCRDRNIIGMQADLMGAASLGLNNVLCITGDRPKLGDYPDATAVFDFDAIGLTSMADRLNHGTDLIGNPIGAPASFLIGVGANPGALNLDEEMGRLERKIAAGANFIMTQPVFEHAFIESFMNRLRKFSKIPVLLGILPLYSYKNAEFLHNEVPGMTIPETLRKRMADCTSKEAGMDEGVKIAREILAHSKSDMAGVYIMPPFGIAKLALGVIE